MTLFFYINLHIIQARDSQSGIVICMMICDDDSGGDGGGGGIAIGERKRETEVAAAQYNELWQALH